tara:strand:- start:877 stop:1527 length:651 start_codon:yes stop_codon:yes gene_type:complete
MALTFRTGSDGKGSALTIEELDNNFRHFTGSHEISGSLIVSSSLIVSGAMYISGSIIPSQETSTLGTFDNPWEELFVSSDSIIFVSKSAAETITSSISLASNGTIYCTRGFSGSLDGNLSGSFTGSATGSFDGDFKGSLSGSLSGSATGSFDGDFTGSFTGSVDTQFNSGSCLISCTSSVTPTGTRPEGTFEFVASGSVYTMYVYLGGAWRSSSLS